MNIKNKKVFIIILVVVLIITAISLLTVNFVKNMKKDREETIKTMEQIKESYKTFSPLVEEFSEKRTEYYTMKDEKLYLEDISDSKEEIISFMDEYSALVHKVHDDSKYLEDNCMRKYSDNRVNNTCNLFKQGYEAIMNYYMTDIKGYNEFVTSYNEWSKESNSALKLDKIEFDLYSDYIDYDKDGSFLGGK